MRGGVIFIKISCNAIEFLGHFQVKILLFCSERGKYKHVGWQVLVIIGRGIV